MKSELSIYIPLAGSCIVATVSLCIGILNFLNPRIIERNKQKHILLTTQLETLTKIKSNINYPLKKLVIMYLKYKRDKDININVDQAEIQEEFYDYLFTLVGELNINRSFLKTMNVYESIDKLINNITEQPASVNTDTINICIKNFIKIVDILDDSVIKIAKDIDKLSS